MDRRSFCHLLAAALVGTEACRPAPPREASRSGLVRILGLREPERAWIDSLSAGEQDELYAALTAASDEAPSRRTVDLLMKVVGRRERLFAYIGYPELPRVGMCDGLIRE
jgi:hypothetical protein